MLKVVGIIIIIAAASFAGNYFSSALKSRAAALKRLNYMLEEIRILLRCKSATVYEIAETLAADERFSEFTFLKRLTAEKDKPFRESWCRAVSENVPRSLKKADTEILLDIGRRLGTTDLEGQLGAVRLWQSELSSAAASAEEDFAKKGKLYRSLGALAGAFIAIMLI